MRRTSPRRAETQLCARGGCKRAASCRGCECHGNGTAVPAGPRPWDHRGQSPGPSKEGAGAISSSPDTGREDARGWARPGAKCWIPGGFREEGGEAAPQRGWETLPLPGGCVRCTPRAPSRSPQIQVGLIHLSFCLNCARASCAISHPALQRDRWTDTPPALPSGTFPCAKCPLGVPAGALPLAKMRPHPSAAVPRSPLPSARHGSGLLKAL